MDSGPLRVPPSSDRRVVNRSESAPQRSSVEEAPITKAEPRPQARAQYTEKQKKSSKRFILPVIIIALVIGLAAAAWFVLSGSKTTETGIDESKYQAVFLSNGQIYFGKLFTYSDGYMRLTDGYFPQAQSETTDEEETADSANGIQLIRLGDEVYGPENEIFISKDQILHYENLRADSRVARLIQQNEQSR